MKQKTIQGLAVRAAAVASEIIFFHAGAHLVQNSFPIQMALVLSQYAQKHRSFRSFQLTYCATCVLLVTSSPLLVTAGAAGATVPRLGRRQRPPAALRRFYADVSVGHAGTL